MSMNNSLVQAAYEAFWHDKQVTPPTIPNAIERWERAVKVVREPLLELIDDMKWQLEAIEDTVCTDEGKRIAELIVRANQELDRA